MLQLFRFECYYQIKQLAFWCFCGVFLFFGFMLGSRSFVFNNEVFNSVYQITFKAGVLSLSIAFASMFQVVNAVLRDQQYHFSSILYSTPIRKIDYFISRYLGVFLISLIVITMALVGFALGITVLETAPERILPFDFWAYWQTWSIMVLPNVFCITALIFSVSMLTRNSLATYLAAVLIYAAYWLCAIFLNSPLLAQALPPDPNNLIIAALADPFGLSAFFEQTQYWTVFQKNNNALSFSGFLFWNRIIWALISSLFLFVAYRFTSFQKANQKNKKKSTPSIDLTPPIPYHPVSPQTNSWQFHWQSFRSCLKIDLAFLFKSLPFWGAMATWSIIILTELHNRVNYGGIYREAYYPTTNYLIECISSPLPFMALILLIFYSGELVWRERQYGIYHITDASPISNFSLFASKLLALLSIPFILIGLAILLAIGFQLSYGYFQLEIDQYLAMFYFNGSPFVVHALVALTFQVLINNKYVGMLVSGVFLLLFTSSLSLFIGLEHPLLQLTRFPKVIYTNMTAYGDYAKPFHYFAVLWFSLALLLAFISYQLWQRGQTPSFLIRIRSIFSIQKKWQWFFPGIAILFFLTSGISIFYHTNIESEFINSKTALDRNEAYERAYKKYENHHRLHQVGIKTKVDFFPEERSYRLHASYLLENKHTVPIQEVLISERAKLQAVQLEKAVLVKHDSLLSTYLFRFPQAIQAGEQVLLTFEIVNHKKAFDTERMLVNNGSYLFPMMLDPVLGYRSSREISDSQERKDRQLPARKEEVVHETHLHSDEAATGKLIIETIISTQADQHAIAPGNLLRAWEEGGRNYFHYKTPKAVVPFLAYLSGRYERQVDTCRGIRIEQYYHPGHQYNISDIARYTQATLAYCIDNFGEYQFDHLRIAETPGHWRAGGMAMPGFITLVENLYLMDVRDSSQFNVVAKRSIHEAAHQWWGHLLMPKDVEGGSLFVEGLAKYTEAVVMEKLLGKRALVQLGRTANSTYFSGRAQSSEPEPAVYLSNGENYLSYGKMYQIMLAMRELIGEKKVNAVLRQLVSDYSQGTEASIVSTDLLKAFYEVSPKKYHVLIDDWFKKVITYDLKIESASVQQIEGNRYEVSIDIHAQRSIILQDGSSKLIDINEPIQLGLFSRLPEMITNPNDILHLQTHTINSAKSKVKVIVNQKPMHIAIDPYNSRTDSNNRDNFFAF